MADREQHRLQRDMSDKEKLKWKKTRLSHDGYVGQTQSSYCIEPFAGKAILHVITLGTSVSYWFEDVKEAKKMARKHYDGEEIASTTSDPTASLNNEFISLLDTLSNRKDG